MAALRLDAELEQLNPPELRTWLAGDWCLIFSHPQDFQAQAKGRRSLEQLRQQLRTRALRVLGVRLNALPESSWIDELHGDQQCVWLAQPSTEATDELSAAARLLRDELLAQQTPFVLFVDGDLRRREVLHYSAGRDYVSTADLLLTVDMLRARPSISRNSYEGQSMRTANARHPPPTPRGTRHALDEAGA